MLLERSMSGVNRRTEGLQKMASGQFVEASLYSQLLSHGFLWAFGADFGLIGWSHNGDLHRGQSFGVASPRAIQMWPQRVHSKPGTFTRGIVAASSCLVKELRERCCGATTLTLYEDQPFHLIMRVAS